MRIERTNDPGPFTRPRDYLPHLQPLFRFRCAYCLTPDDRLGGAEAMKVDHFHPESRHPELRLAWRNLYYSCDVCNNRKSDFPTDEESAQGLRFVDPCDEDPNDHFRMVRDAESGDFCHVAHLSDPAEYTIRRLQFNTRRFLRDFWRELHAAERMWTERRQNAIDLKAKVDEPDDDADALLAQCESELATIRDRWPFPRDQ